MDWIYWREKFIDGAPAGVTAFVATWLIKIFKKNLNPIKRVLTNSSDIDFLKNEVTVLKNEILERHVYIRAFIDISRSAIYHTNRHGGVIWVNTKWLEITGFTKAEEAYGEGFMEALTEEDQEEMRAINRGYSEQPRDVTGKVTFINQATLRETHCKFRSKAIFNSKGEFVMGLGILEIIQD